MQLKVPGPETWANWILTEREGIEEVILTHIRTAEPYSILPNSVRKLASNMWQVVTSLQKKESQVKPEPVDTGTPETVMAEPVIDPVETPSSVPENAI